MDQADQTDCKHPNIHPASLSDTIVINVQAFEQPSCLEDIVHILARRLFAPYAE